MGTGEIRIAEAANPRPPRPHPRTQQSQRRRRLTRQWAKR